MKVNILHLACKLSLLSISILAVACQKEPNPNDETNEQLYTLTFDFKDFDASTKPLNARARVSHNSKLRASGVAPLAQIGHLYFWSFNAQSLAPDIASHSDASITYQASGQPTYTSTGWAFENYSAGHALSIAGLTELLITMPITRATELDELGFDMTSTNTGPKSFSLEYSFDQSNWIMKSTENQFIYTTANTKNSFVFDFSDLTVKDEDFFYIRLVPMPGERGSGSNYNPTQGVTRFDNIRLTGLATAPTAYSVDKLHYYVFNTTSAELVDSDVLDFNPSTPNIDLALPYGQYQVAFVRNHSAASLLLSTQLTDREQFYYANPFSNHLANIFAAEMAVTLDEDKQESVTLERYYSQIKFEFTDARDLSHISRIVISQEHEPCFYAPYGDMPNPVLDQSDITLEPNLGQSQEIVFNQFLGNTSTPQEIAYRLDVYGTDNELLRTFSVSASIRHNVQLVFRGELLFGINQQAGFQISFNEDWDDEVVIGF